MVSQRWVSPTKRGQLFCEWCERNEVQRFLFDLDDTICRTREKFINRITECIDLLNVKRPDVPNWREKFETTNNQFFESHGVNPRRWQLIMDELQKVYELNREMATEGLRVLMKIYFDKVVFLDGAETMLKFLSKTKVKIGIVTHANVEWTKRKYGWLGLERFLAWDNVFIIDENGHKTDESWREACRFFGSKPDNVAVVGDSPRSDINPARTIGVKHCFLLEDPKQWSVHQQAVGQEVRRVKNLAGIIDIGMEVSKKD